MPSFLNDDGEDHEVNNTTSLPYWLLLIKSILDIDHYRNMGRIRYHIPYALEKVSQRAYLRIMSKRQIMYVYVPMLKMAMETTIIIIIMTIYILYR